jgi:flagellar motor switch protein FliM
MEVRFENTSATISLLVPHRSIEPALGQLPGGHYGPDEDLTPDPAAAEAVRSSLATVDVEMRAEVASVEMSLDDVVALKPGDLIRFRAPVAAGVTMFADAVPMYRAQPGRSGKWRAVQIHERLEDDL